MINVVPVQEIGDARGVRRDIFSLSRGFSTALASSGEGFGRGLTHEDIKKEASVKATEKLPHSIDEIVLPFFAPKGNKLEQVTGENAFYVLTPSISGPAKPFAGQNRAYHWTAHAPSAALDVRTASLPYARTNEDYSQPQIQEYYATAYVRSAKTGTLVTYARANIAPTVLVPPTVAFTSKAHTPETLRLYVGAQPIQTYSEVNVTSSIHVPLRTYTHAKIFAQETQQTYTIAPVTHLQPPITPLPSTLQLHVKYVAPWIRQTLQPKAESTQPAKTENNNPIELMVQQEKAKRTFIAEKSQMHEHQQTTIPSSPPQQRLGISALQVAVQQYVQQLSATTFLPAVEQRFPGMHYSPPQPTRVQAKYALIKLGTNELSQVSLAGRYALPFITAMGLSMIPAPSFSHKQIAVQHEPQIAERKNTPLSSLVEPYRLTTAAKQPQSLEKIKRELPTYDRVAAPAALEARALEIEAKYGCVVSFKVISVADGHTWGRKDTSIIPPASVSKLGLVYAAMMLAQDGQLDLEQRIDIKQLVEQNPRLLPKNVGEQVQNRYTLREMLEEIVKDKQQGSNLLANVLLSMIGKDKANELLRKGGFKHTSFASDAPYTPKGDYHNNATTLEEAARLMDILGDAKYWKPQYQEALGEILQASKNWMPFLFGPNSKEGKIALRNVKHGQTENAMSVVYDAIGSDGRKYVGIISMTNLPGRLVEENYRKATEMGKQAVNDFTQLSRLVYSHLESVQGASFK